MNRYPPLLLLPLIAPLLAQNTPAPSLHRIELLAHSIARPPVVVSLARDQRLRLEIFLTAPAVESAVEPLEIAAENQQKGYWEHRQGPNIFVKSEHTISGEQGKSVRTRIFYSGGGKSLHEHSVDVDIEFLDFPEVRKNRLRSFLEKTMPSQPQGRLDAAAAYLDRLYIANPPGTYDLSITYQPTTGIFAGQVLTRRLIVNVSDGPDSLDRMLEPPARRAPAG